MIQKIIDKVIQKIREEFIIDILYKELVPGGRYLLLLPESKTLTGEDLEELSRQLDLEEKDIRLAIINAEKVSILELIK